MPRDNHKDKFLTSAEDNLVSARSELKLILHLKFLSSLPVLPPVDLEGEHPESCDPSPGLESEQKPAQMRRSYF